MAKEGVLKRKHQTSGMVKPAKVRQVEEMEGTENPKISQCDEGMDVNNTVRDLNHDSEESAIMQWEKPIENILDPDDVMLRRFVKSAVSVSEIEVMLNKTKNVISKDLGTTITSGSQCTVDEAIALRDILPDKHVVPRLRDRWRSIYGDLTDLNKDLLASCLTYADFAFPSLTSSNLSEVQRTICFHLLNHVFKSRATVLRHNRELSAMDVRGEIYDADDYRDQCITRPSCLILTPFRSSAHTILSNIIQLFEDSKKHKISKKKRFNIDYGPEGFEPISDYRPQDFLDLMSGNADDDFKIGLSVSPKQIRLYTHFYRADIIIASPLGLFQIVGDSQDRKREIDFLSGLQVVYLDQADVFLMQNWSHVISIFKDLNKKPLDSHDVNFSRVYEWCLDEQMKYFRQTIITSKIKSAEFNSISSKFCFNLTGRLEHTPPVVVEGELNRIVSQIVHVFRKFNAPSCSEHDNVRFDVFTKQIMKELRDLIDCKIVIFISDYFDYVRVRNYLRRNSFGFVAISEYDVYKKARFKMRKFRQGDAKFMLITERFHFFNRLFVKGIERIFFYQLPRYPHFYSELCNMVGVGARENVEMSCSALFCKYDCLRLAPIVNDENCKKLISSTSQTHMFITGQKGS